MPAPLAIGGLMMQGGGAIMRAQHAQKQQELAEKNYRMALEAYYDELNRQGRLDDDVRYQQAIQNQMAFSNAAQGMENQAEKVYGAYNRGRGR
jgi:hypothetical protein